MGVRIHRAGSRAGGSAEKLSVALLVLLFGTTLLALTGRLSGTSSHPPAPDSVLVPVPAEYVPPGTRGRDIELRLVRLDRAQLPADALTSAADLREGQALRGLPPNLPISASSFTLPTDEDDPLMERIPPGMRAMTIEVDSSAFTEALAQPGALVDVLLIETGRTSVVAEQVGVLTIDREGSRGVAVTLLVTQKQCLAINTAIPLGRISFALRNDRDRERWSQTRLDAESVTGSNRSQVRPMDIRGYASIKGDGSVRRFVLADGKWMRSAEEHADAIAESTVGAEP